MAPFASVVQQRSGAPCGACQPGGHAGHATGVGSGEPQSHGGHVWPGPHEGHAQPPPDAVHSVAPLASVWQHSLPEAFGGVYQPGGHALAQPVVPPLLPLPPLLLLELTPPPLLLVLPPPPLLLLELTPLPLLLLLLLPTLPPLALAAVQAPDPSSGQHVRGSGYVVAPSSHGVKGAFG
jgi:hypothetical protein